MGFWQNENALVGDERLAFDTRILKRHARDPDIKWTCRDPIGTALEAVLACGLGFANA